MAARVYGIYIFFQKVASWHLFAFGIINSLALRFSILIVNFKLAKPEKQLTNFAFKIGSFGN